jgi:hypothetical protein
MGYWDNVTPQSVENAKDGFKEFGIGDNEAFVKMAEEKYSESGNPMLVITFANNEGAEIKHFIVDGEYKLQKLKQFYIAFGIPFGSSDIEAWRGKRGIVVCKQGEPYNGKVYNKVSYLRPMPGANINRHSAHTQESQPAQSQQPYNPPADQTRPDDEFDDDIPF